MNNIIPWIVLALIIILVFWIIMAYNALIAGRNGYKNAYSQIDVQLKRRHDLIPNLVNTVKAYLTHERETLEAVIKARNQAQTAGQAARAAPGAFAQMRGVAQAEGELTASLGKLFAVKEDYPELQGNENVGQLFEEITSTENRISFARQAFNDTVTDYNNRAQSFPSNLIANKFGFQEAALMESIANTAEAQAPLVSL